MTDDEKSDETAETKFERFEEALKRVLSAPKPPPKDGDGRTDKP